MKLALIRQRHDGASRRRAGARRRARRGARRHVERCDAESERVGRDACAGMTPRLISRLRTPCSPTSKRARGGRAARRRHDGLERRRSGGAAPLVEATGGAFVYGANFSVGVNLFYRIIARAAGTVRARPKITSRSSKRRTTRASAMRRRARRFACATSSPSNSRATSPSPRRAPDTFPARTASALIPPADQITLTHTAR